MLDLKFKEIEIEDKSLIDPILRQSASFCLSFFTFASLASWNSTYHYKWAISEDTLLIKLTTLEDNKEHFLQPVGVFPPTLQKKIINYASSIDYDLTIYGISDSFIEKFPDFVSHFEKTKHREMDNYIYSAEDLALLKGNDYQPKRNLIHQFENKYNWSVEPILDVNIIDCYSVIHKMYKREGQQLDEYLLQELNALDFNLKHFTVLEQEGILIRIDNKPVALSIFESLNSNTCVIHFEKAIRDYKGLYQLINREAAKIIYSKGCQYINREEDLGIEGLRKAKLSYNPLSLCPATALVYKK